MNRTLSLMPANSMIHPTAIIDPSAKLAADVEVGAYSLIGAGVEIGAGTRVGSHVVIQGATTIGARNQIWQFASIGADPQDKKYAGEPTRLSIGDDNTIREFVTINRGTVQDSGLTTIGNHNWIMAYVHIAHDCVVGNHTIFANNASLAGHVHIGDWVILGGFTGVHQFGKVGAHAMCGMNTSLTQDVPPYVMVTGNPAGVHGVNSEGLKRRGFSAESIRLIRQAYKLLYRSALTLEQARAAIAALSEQHSASAIELNRLTDFLAHVTRGIVR